MSSINTTNIDPTKPESGNASTQSVRDNTQEIKDQLDNAASDIGVLETDFDGAGASGIVPDPTSETGKFLKDDGTWDFPSAGGNPEGTAVLSTSETVGKVLTADGDDTCSWQPASTGGISSFDVGGDTGDTLTIVDGEELSIEGGTGIDTVAASGTPETITVSVASDVLTGVVVDSPTAEQVLKYDGANWINSTGGTVSAGTGVEFFFDTTDIIPGTTGTIEVDTLASSPSLDSEEEIQTPVKASTSPITVASYLTPNALGRTKLDAGTWDFHTFMSIDANAGTSTLAFSVLAHERHHAGTCEITGSDTSRTLTVTGATPFTADHAKTDVTLASGVVTPTAHFYITGFTDSSTVTIQCLADYVNESGVAYYVDRWLFSKESDEINGSAIQSQNLVTVQSEFDIETTDHLEVHVFAKTTANSDKTISFYHNGTEHYSHLSTPLSTIHSDLAVLGADDHVQYLLADGSRALGGAWDMGNQALTNVNIDSGAIEGSIVDAAGAMMVDANINSQSGTAYTVLTTDAGKTIVCTNDGGAVTITLDDALPTGFQCTVIQKGTSIVTIEAENSDTMNGTAAGDVVIAAQYRAGYVTQYDDDKWLGVV